MWSVYVSSDFLLNNTPRGPSSVRTRLSAREHRNKNDAQSHTCGSTPTLAPRTSPRSSHRLSHTLHNRTTPRPTRDPTSRTHTQTLSLALSRLGTTHSTQKHTQRTRTPLGAHARDSWSRQVPSAREGSAARNALTHIRECSHMSLSLILCYSFIRASRRRRADRAHSGPSSSPPPPASRSSQSEAAPSTGRPCRARPPPRCRRGSTASPSTRPFCCSPSWRWRPHSRSSCPTLALPPSRTRHHPASPAVRSALSARRSRLPPRRRHHEAQCPARL